MNVNDISKWLLHQYDEYKFELWMLGCPDKNTFIKTMIGQTPGDLKNKLEKFLFNQYNISIAYQYCSELINRSWPIGEPVLALSATFAYNYARFIIKKPFPMGEPVIATDSLYAYNYAFWIIKGPWPLGEEAIATDSYYALKYAVALKKPFPLGEKSIRKNKYCNRVYNSKFGVQL